jgi:antitoxin (DNA-binding transcriptional repressor) of toxin-antitoxin stability system
VAITASELRANVYRLLDQVLETGEPLEIERAGRRLRIVAADPGPPVGSKLERLKGRGNPNAIVGDPEDLVHMDWSVYWNPDPT